MLLTLILNLVATTHASQNYASQQEEPANSVKQSIARLEQFISSVQENDQNGYYRTVEASFPKTRANIYGTFEDRNTYQDATEEEKATLKRLGSTLVSLLQAIKQKDFSNENFESSNYPAGTLTIRPLFPEA